MFDNLTLIAAFVVLLWLVTSAVYLYVSRQQSSIEEEIHDLSQRLDRLEEEDH